MFFDPIIQFKISSIHRITHVRPFFNLNLSSYIEILSAYLYNIYSNIPYNCKYIIIIKTYTVYIILNQYNIYNPYSLTKIYLLQYGVAGIEPATIGIAIPRSSTELRTQYLIKTTGNDNCSIYV